MKKSLIATALIFFTGLWFSSAQEIKFSGEAGSLWSPAVRSKNRGAFVLSDTYLNGKIDTFYEKSSAYAEGKAGFDGVSEKTYYELKEIYIDYSDALWGFRAGRQKIVWGKADGVDITNVICPKDYSSNRALFGDECLAVDSVRGSFNKDSVCADIYYIPLFTPSALPEEKTEMLSSTNMPAKNLRSAEYALKLSGYFSKCDISLYGFYGWEDTPFLSYVPKIENGLQAGIEVTADYERMAMAGCDAAVPFGETVLRLEAAFFPKRHFQTATQEILSGSRATERHNNLLALAGLDWMPEGWTFTAQYYCDYVFGSLNLLEREKNYTQGASLSMSKSLLAETLKLSASGILNLNDMDSAVELSAEYSLTDCIYLEAGSYIFNRGKEHGTYGEYENLTNVYLKARYVF